MMKATLKKSMDSLVRDNTWLRILLAIAVVTSLIGTIGMMGKDQRYILSPVTLTDDAWVEKDAASATYDTAWGAFLGMLMGNLTPSNLQFVKERLEPLLAPEIYNQTLETFERQAQEFRDNRITVSFELRSVDFEPETGKVFAYGYQYAKGVGADKPKRSERTFEYKIRIRNYLPEITHIDTYQSKPRTERILRLENAQKQSRQ